VTHVTVVAGSVGQSACHQQRPIGWPNLEGDAMTLARTIRQIGLMLAFTVSVSVLSTSAGHAFSSEAQQMCTGDAFRLCSSEIPNIPKITACMIKNKSNLSPGCRAVMDKDQAASRKASKVAVKSEAAKSEFE
jgi:hypothetical protein